MHIDGTELTLDLDIDHEIYRGYETIFFSSEEGEICINSDWHKITKSLLNGEEVNLEKGENSDEFLIKGDFSRTSELYFEFEGELKYTMTGLYLSKSSTGQKIVSTQFETIGARKAFPCFDRPDLKSPFLITVTVDSQYSVISNMDVSEKIEDNGKTTFTFQETPSMSTYLIYIGSGKFDFRERTHGETRIILTAPQGTLNSTDEPIDMAAKFLDLFSEYFSIPYVLPKVHLISVPEFAAGAMENWGAITFRETAIMINENTTDMARRTVAEIIAHELAHQWFGNLVTMKWWDDIWLNESFATFMGFKAADLYNKDWRAQGTMLILDGFGAFTDDSLLSTDPIESHMKHPDEMEGMSSNIRYGKGGMVLRMIEKYLGPDTFRDSLRAFLKKHAYGNAEGADLWNTMSEVSHQPVQMIMESWIRNKGYPFISVKQVPKGFELTQSRFLLSGQKVEDQWPIPVTVVREDSEESFLLTNPTQVIHGQGFVKLNSKMTGFYRVLYEKSMYGNLAKKFPMLDFQDRINLLADMAAFSIAGMISIDDYSEFIETVWHDLDLHSIIQVSNDLNTMRNLRIKDQKLKRLFTRFHRYQFEALQVKKQLNEDDIAIKGLISARLVSTDIVTRRHFSKMFPDLLKAKPEMRETICNAYALENDSFKGLLSMYSTLSSDSDRVNVLRGMAKLTGTESLNSVLKLIDQGIIKKQDMMTYFLAIGSWVPNAYVALEGAEKIMETIRRHSTNSGRLSLFIRNSLPILAVFNRNQVLKILDDIKDPKLTGAIEKAKERIEVNTRFHNM